jgi:hypothetical protein
MRAKAPTLTTIPRIELGDEAYIAYPRQNFILKWTYRIALREPKPVNKRRSMKAVSRLIKTL